MENYYKTLGVDENASQEEIKIAYRKLARNYHPDINKDDTGSSEKFKKINEAYEVIGNPTGRANYDAGLHGNHFNFGGGFGDVFQHVDEIFGSFFSRGFETKKKKRRKNLNLTTKIKLTFEEAVLGCRKTVRFSRNSTCDICRGSGASTNSDLIGCRTCHGSGVFSHNQGFMSIQVTCHDCGGAGKFITHPCKRCEGNGVMPEKKETSIDIPPGVDEDLLLQVHGLGHTEKHTGDTGNLLIQLKIQPSQIFERDGLNIISSKEVPFTTLALGGNLSIDTVHGTTSVFIEAGTKSGHVVKSRGYGVKLRNGDTGFQFTRISVEVPDKMNQQQIEALRSFKNVME